MVYAVIGSIPIFPKAKRVKCAPLMKSPSTEGVETLTPFRVSKSGYEPLKMFAFSRLSKVHAR